MSIQSLSFLMTYKFLEKHKWQSFMMNIRPTNPVDSYPCYFITRLARSSYNKHTIHLGATHVIIALLLNIIFSLNSKITWNRIFTYLHDGLHFAKQIISLLHALILLLCENIKSECFFITLRWLYITIIHIQFQHSNYAKLYISGTQIHLGLVLPSVFYSH